MNSSLFILHISIFKDHKCRNTPDSKTISYFRIFIYINFNNTDLICKFCCYLL